MNSDLVAGVAPKSSRYGSEMKRERERVKKRAKSEA